MSTLPIQLQGPIPGISAATQAMLKKGYNESIPDEGVSRASSMETMSQAATSDSGKSDEIGITNDRANAMRRAMNSRKGAAAAGAARAARAAKDDNPLSGATGTCSMCDTEASEYLCVQCGRLSFCTKCCLNLHDNKFLGGHKFLSLDLVTEGEERTLSQIKAGQLEKMEEEKQKRRAMSTRGSMRAVSDLGSEMGGKMDGTLIPTTQASTHIVDPASLAADRSVINVRVKELKSCLEFGSKLHHDLAAERTITKENTATAAEAVRRKFDVLRNLITAKEDEYVKVVEEAGKERFEAATSATCSLSIANAELDGFISHLTLQLNRLEENRAQFDSDRKELLESTARKLTEVDGWTHDHQTQLEDIRNMALGVHVPIEKVAECIQDMTPPARLVHRSQQRTKEGILSATGETQSPDYSNATSGIPAAKFLSSPGVKVTRQAHPIVPNNNNNNNSNSINTTMNSAYGVNSHNTSTAYTERGGTPVRGQSVGRRSSTGTGTGTMNYSAIEKDDVRSRNSTPLRGILNNNATNNNYYNNNMSGTSSRTGTPTRHSTNLRSNPIVARMAARTVSQQQQQYNSAAPTPVAAPRAGSPRAASPLQQPQGRPTSSFLSGRNNSPNRPQPLVRGQSPTHHSRQSPSRIGTPIHRGSGDNPGPGAYNPPKSTFDRRGVTSTPPRGLRR